MVSNNKKSSTSSELPVVKTASGKIIFIVVMVLLGFAGGLFFAYTNRNDPGVKSKMVEAQVEAETNGNILLKTLKQTDPATYNEVVAALRHGMESNKSQAEIRAIITPMVVKVIFAKIPYASDAVIIRLAKQIALEYRELRPVSTDLCYQYAMVGMDVTQHLGKDTQQKEAALSAEVLTTYDPKLHVVNQEEAQAGIKKVTDHLQAKFGKSTELFAQTTHNAAEKSKVCDMSIEMFEFVATLPEARAAAALRFIFSHR